jgi:peptidoglycan/LPS O-acetylase OafA/YrhL
MTQNLKARIVFLDYMRIFAFVSVLVGHKLSPELLAVTTDPTAHVTLRLLAEWAYALCYGGAAGVTVFFLTSGYIITHVLQSETPIEFLIKRIFRIYPLYIVALILEALMWYRIYGVHPAPLSVLIPQALLIGDFFGTPYALAGVEWTLRIEIMFYVLMGLLKALGLFNHQKWMPLLFAAIAWLLFVLPEIPGKEVAVHGYFSMYVQFLLIGSLLYMAENGKANVALCVLAILGMGYAFLARQAVLHPGWKESHFALIAIGLFSIAWLSRYRLHDGKILRTLSDLTYSVYLFHNWLWLYLTLVLQYRGVKFIPLNLQVLLALLLICYTAHKLIELPAIQLGRRVLALYRRNKPSSAASADTSIVAT